MQVTTITSAQNHRVKTWLQFQKGHFRNKSAFFLVEGIKECSRGLDSGFVIRELILCPEILGDESFQNLVNQVSEHCAVFTVSKTIYHKLAYRKESGGIIGLFEKKVNNLASLSISEDKPNYFIILENIEKPGNLGAILRTADAVQANAVILTGKSTDEYNPNVLRASLGTLFTVPVVKSKNEDILLWAKSKGISLFCAALPAFGNLYEIRFPINCACIFGAEDTGVSDFWLKQAELNFTIPMRGIVDSLNLSVSAAIVSYEFMRQQKK